MRDRLIGAVGMLRGGVPSGNAYRQRGRVPLGGAQLLSLGFAVPRRLALALALFAAWPHPVHAAAPAPVGAPAGRAVPLDVELWRLRYLAATRRQGAAPVHDVAESTQFVVGSLRDKPMGALLFTLERGPEGGAWTQTAALFWARGGHYLFCCLREVGAAHRALISGLALDGESLRVQGKAYTDGDAACCPSRPVTARYTLTHRRLTLAPEPR